MTAAAHAGGGHNLLTALGARRIRLTRRVIGVPGAAVAVYLAAANSLVVWLYVVAAMLIALVPIGIAGPLRSTRRPTVLVRSHHREGFVAPFASDHSLLFAGDELELALSTDLDSHRCSFRALVLDSGERWPVEVTQDDIGRPLVRCVVPKRGRFRISGVDVFTSWPVGMLRVEVVVPLALTVIAHPQYTLIAQPRQSVGDIGGERALRRGQGDEPSGLREYRSGDTRRQIHWQTTARAGQLMVVERSTPAAEAFSFSLVLEHGATPAAAELAVGLTASVAAGCSAAGRPYRLAVGDGAPQARGWSDTLGRLAVVTTPAQGSVAGTVRIAATGAAVAITSPDGDGVEIPDHTPLAEAGTALARMLS